MPSGRNRERKTKWVPRLPAGLKKDTCLVLFLNRHQVRLQALLNRWAASTGDRKLTQKVVYSFPMVAITNYKHGGWKQQKWIPYSSGSQSSTSVSLGWNRDVSRATLPLEPFWKLPAFVTSLYSRPLSSHHLLSYVCNLTLALSYKDTCELIRSTIS